MKVAGRQATVEADGYATFVPWSKPREFHLNQVGGNGRVHGQVSKACHAHHCLSHGRWIGLDWVGMDCIGSEEENVDHVDM